MSILIRTYIMMTAPIDALSAEDKELLVQALINDVKDGKGRITQKGPKGHLERHASHSRLQQILLSPSPHSRHWEGTRPPPALSSNERSA